MSGRIRVRSAGCVLGLSLVLPQILSAQTTYNSRNANPTPASSTASATDASTAVSRNVSGRVLNALTGAPVPRALVNLNSRAMLTDAQGKFTFLAFTDANGYAQVSKPGYSASPTVENSRQQKIPDLDALVELRLYPDATLTGTITGADSLPLARIQVRLRRLSYDSTGARWVQAGFAQSDVHGDYRFSVPAGRYRVSTGYTPRSTERGEAVLPVSFPPASASNTEAFDLASGEQRQVDLRPRVGPSYPVALKVEGGDFDRGLRLTATSASGVTFQLGTQRNGDQMTTQLPAGTFTLRANAGDRNEPLEAESRVIVTSRGAAEADLHLAPQPAFPVEVAAELAPVVNGATVPTVPSAQQFNLNFHNLANAGESFDADARITIRPDRSSEFDLAPGRYRLTGSLNGGWYIRSATSGVTDLLSEDLVVAGGAAGTPIRLVISNAVGSVRGTVTTAGLPASGWVYLVPQQPSLTPYVELSLQTDGTFQWSGAPGKYIVVPASQPVREDFHNLPFRRKFEAAGRPVEITPGAAASVDLTLAPAGVAR